jgi:hypothetical protein
MQRRLAVIAALVLTAVLAGLGVRAYTLRAERDERKLRALEGQFGRMQAELSALRSREPQVIHVERPGDPPSLPTGAWRAASGAPFVLPADDESLEASQQRDAKFAAALDRRLEQEPVDGSWRMDSLRAIQTSLAELAPRARLVDATCASTLCRVVVSHESPADQRALGSAIAEHPPFDQGTHYVRSFDPPTTTLYVVRTGHDVRNEVEEARH